MRRGASNKSQSSRSCHLPPERPGRVCVKSWPEAVCGADACGMESTVMRSRMWERRRCRATRDRATPDCRRRVAVGRWGTRMAWFRRCSRCAVGDQTNMTARCHSQPFGKYIVNSKLHRTRNVSCRDAPRSIIRGASGTAQRTGTTRGVRSKMRIGRPPSVCGRARIAIAHDASRTQAPQ